jgi:hypothetical protein
MPSVIDRAVKALRGQGVSHETSHREVSVPAALPDGFRVTLQMRGDREFAVQCDGWFETFGRGEDAYDCFTFALSDQCRLQIIRRGDTPVEWQLQRREYGMWSPGRPVRRRLAPLWRRAHLEYRHNRFFQSAPSGGAADEPSPHEGHLEE